MNDFEKLARGLGIWIEPTPAANPIPAQPTAEGQAATPPPQPKLSLPQTKPGYPARNSGPGNRK